MESKDNDYTLHGNLKDYLVKVLNHPTHLIIVLLQYEIIMVPKQE